MKLPNRGRKRSYFMNIALGFDQFIGTLFGIDCDESISSWCGRNKDGKWQQIWIDWLFLKLFNQYDHCYYSMERHADCK